MLEDHVLLRAPKLYSIGILRPSTGYIISNKGRDHGSSLAKGLFRIPPVKDRRHFFSLHVPDHQKREIPGIVSRQSNII